MEILHADPRLLAVDKPAGMPAVPGGWGEVGLSLLEQLEAEYGRLWIVHRLDKVTSGVMLFARTAESHRELSRLFEAHGAKKAYHALLSGEPGWEEHHARHPLRLNTGHRHRSVVDHARGKPCETRFRVLERGAGACLVEACPLTGRTHQIRAHASALGHPLLGDALYGASPTEIISRPALHSCRLEFELEGELFSLQAPYPEDFARALEAILGHAAG